jgi:hypothetical protein
VGEAPEVELEMGKDDGGCRQRPQQLERYDLAPRAALRSILDSRRVPRWCLASWRAGGDAGQDTTLRRGVTLSASRRSPIAPAMKRAVIGVPL